MDQLSSSGETADLRDFIASELGPDLAVEDRSRAFGRKSITWRVETASGDGFYLKRHEHRTHYHAEKVALTEWVPKLEKNERWYGPEVVADSPELGALLLTEVQGEIVEEVSLSGEDESEIYRTAGWLASQVHGLDVDPLQVGKPRLYDSTLIREYIEKDIPYLDTETLQWAESVAAADGLFAGLAVVPTHSDYSPRNWLIHKTTAGLSLGVIDWERARPTFWLEDAQRLAYDYWLKRPELRDAFFDGYGKQPTATEDRQLKLICLANALGTVSWATEHDDFQFADFGRRTIERLKSEL